jgi:hypothetical protein
MSTNAAKREVDTMAASIIVEEDAGVFSGYVPSHNGYYAGDFSASHADAKSARPQLTSVAPLSGYAAA